MRRRGVGSAKGPSRKRSRAARPRERRSKRCGLSPPASIRCQRTTPATTTPCPSTSSPRQTPPPPGLPTRRRPTRPRHRSTGAAGGADTDDGRSCGAGAPCLAGTDAPRPDGAPAPGGAGAGSLGGPASRRGPRRMGAGLGRCSKPPGWRDPPCGAQGTGNAQLGHLREQEEAAVRHRAPAARRGEPRGAPAGLRVTGSRTLNRWRGPPSPLCVPDQGSGVLLPADPQLAASTPLDRWCYRPWDSLSPALPLWRRRVLRAGASVDEGGAQGPGQPDVGLCVRNAEPRSPNQEGLPAWLLVRLSRSNHGLRDSFRPPGPRGDLPEKP